MNGISVSPRKTNPTMMSYVEKESDDTRLVLVEKAVLANSEAVKVVGDSLREGLFVQSKNLDRTVDALERFRERMEVSFDSMSKSMADLNSTMYKQGFQMIHYFRWYTIMGIITVVAVCILAGSNFYFKWKEVELRSGSYSAERVFSPATQKTLRQVNDIQEVQLPTLE